MEWDWANWLFPSEPCLPICTVRLGVLACHTNGAEKGDSLQFVKGLGRGQGLGSHKSLQRTRGP